METKTAIQQRRTIRRFKQQTVTDSEIRELINAGRLASCGGNQQQLRYLVIQNPELVEKVFHETAWGGSVKPNRNPEWGKNAPLTFILLTSPANSGNIVYADAGAAIENIQLCATDMGLGCCWIGAFKKGPVTKILQLPEDKEAVFLVAVGYPDESPVQEDIGSDDDKTYYLDDKDVLHVPKYTLDALTEWV